MGAQETTGNKTAESLSAREAWQEVGRQFQILGETLGAAFRASWQDPESRQRVAAMQSSLEEMVRSVDAAIQKAAASPEMEQAKSEAKRAAESLRTAGEQTVQELRPHLLSALRDVNRELQKLVERMEQGTSTPRNKETSPHDRA